MLANRLPENIHLIVSGRNAFLSGKEILRLGKSYIRSIPGICV